MDHEVSRGGASSWLPGLLAGLTENPAANVPLLDWTVNPAVNVPLLDWTVNPAVNVPLLDWTVNPAVNVPLLDWTVNPAVNVPLLDWTVNPAVNVPLLDWTVNPAVNVPLPDWTVNPAVNVPLPDWTVDPAVNVPRLDWTVDPAVNVPLLDWTVNPAVNVPLLDARGRKDHSSESTLICPSVWHAGVQKSDRADILPGKTTITNALRLGRSEVLRSLRHYPEAAGTKSRTSHHRSPGGERRRKGRSLTILLETRRKSFCQSDEHWNCFNDSFGKRLRNGVQRIWTSPSAPIPPWSELSVLRVHVEHALRPLRALKVPCSPFREGRLAHSKHIAWENNHSDDCAYPREITHITHSVGE